MASLNNYYTFYLIDHFHQSVQSAQLLLFLFLASVAAGVVLRRPDRRPVRPQIRDLGVDPGRAAVYPVCCPMPTCSGLRS